MSLPTKSGNRQTASGKTNLNTIFGTIIASLLLLVGLRVFLLLQSGKNLKASEVEGTATSHDIDVGLAPVIPKERVKKNSRPRVKSAATFSLAIDTAKTSNLLMDMSDQGDLLVYKPDDPPTNVVHLRGDETLGKYTSTEANRLVFTETGNLKTRQGIGGDTNREYPQAYTISDNRMVSLVFDNGSFLTVADKSVGRSPVFALQRQSEDSSPTVYYTSTMPICILERSDKNVFWFRTPKSLKSVDDDLLFRLRQENVEAIQMPPQYHSVDRVCQTGDTIAASFGSPASKEPIRAFLRDGTTWTELPIPDGFDSSFVQKITFSGIILGYVENSKSGLLQPIAWKDKSCLLLSSLPKWPAKGETQLIYKANRRGDMWVIYKGNPKTSFHHVFIKELGEK